MCRRTRLHMEKNFKGDNGVRPPKILGQHRKALKFINAVFTKYLKNADPHESLIGIENKKN